MKERPINMRAEEVRAILAGRKTQFRRVFKFVETNQPPACPDQFNPQAVTQPCPFGQPGDRLWVRETWQSFGDSSTIAPPVPHRCQVRYDATGETAWIPVPEGARGVFPASLKRLPSIFMPRWACRIILEVVSVRVERLKEITHDDAICEGCQPHPDAPHQSMGRDFERLWQSIYGPGSWAENPWVWVVEFKVIEGGAQ